jgi:Putative beta-barrel porin-2, OmpL-like. bbp2
MEESGELLYGSSSPKRGRIEMCELIEQAVEQRHVRRVLEGNYTVDESVPGGARAYGAAGYLVYAVNDWLLLGLREEVFRDNTGFCVGSFAAKDNFIGIERGKTNNIDPCTFFSAGTFDEVTVGATFKLPLLRRPGGLMIRPELRYDAALSSNTTAFSPSRNHLPLRFAGAVA